MRNREGIGFGEEAPAISDYPFKSLKLLDYFAFPDGVDAVHNGTLRASIRVDFLAGVLPAMTWLGQPTDGASID
jgi:hypothetical protein